MASAPATAGHLLVRAGRQAAMHRFTALRSVLAPLILGVLGGVALLQWMMGRAAGLVLHFKLQPATRPCFPSLWPQAAGLPSASHWLNKHTLNE